MGFVLVFNNNYCCCGRKMFCPFPELAPLSHCVTLTMINWLLYHWFHCLPSVISRYLQWGKVGEAKPSIFVFLQCISLLKLKSAALASIFICLISPSWVPRPTHSRIYVAPHRFLRLAHILNKTRNQRRDHGKSAPNVKLMTWWSRFASATPYQFVEGSRW